MIVSILGIAGCRGSSESKVITNPYKKTSFLMGTVVTVKIYNENKESALHPAFERIEELINKVGVNELDSEIDEINAKAGIEPVNVSIDTFNLVNEGKKYSEKADGSFDITIGPLTSLWHIGFPDARKPSQLEIDQVLPSIDFQKIILDEKEQTIFLQEKGMQIDLGAIAKGFITDEVAAVLKEQGVTTALIDLGGNIYVMGNHPKGEEWTVGIQDPFSSRGEIIGKIKESDKSIVTSGIYERFLEINNQQYHHILNPKDGYPFSNDIAGITVVTEKSIDGDALSTSVYSKGIEGGMKYLEEFPGVEAIFVSKDKKVYITSGLKNEFELTKEGFEMENLPSS